MNALQEEEWLKAQEISISVDPDLISAAKQHLRFLASVDRNRCLYDGPVLQRAICRYEQCWLPLLAEHTVCGIAKFQLVVPLDCEWIWHCHRLNPIQYEKDCKQIYGRILDACFVESSIQESDRKQTQLIWQYYYPEEPYELDLSHSVSADSTGIFFKVLHMIEYNLTEAVHRQSSFVHQVSQPYVFDDRFLKGAEERYKGFLYLIKKNRDSSANYFCVPTYDVDLMWHSHQLQPVAYARDTLYLLGKVLEHDDTDSDRSEGKKLDVGFTETKKQWETTYGKRYWRAGALHKGEAPAPVPVAPLSSEHSDCENSCEDSDCEHSDCEESECVCESLFQSNKDQYLDPVNIVEVLLEVVGIRNIPKDHRGTLFVRFYRNNCLGKQAKKVEITSESQSKRIASFQCKASGDFIFELRTRSSRTVKRGSKCLGQVSIPVQQILDSPTLSVENWFPLSSNRHPDGSDPISLHIAVSVTPPTTAHLLWSVRPHWFERKLEFLEYIRRIKGSEKVTRFLDHDHKDVFTVKTRTTAKPFTGSFHGYEEGTLRGAADKRQIVIVYQRNPNSKKSRSSGETVAKAEEMITADGTAQWAIMNSCNLLIRNLDNITKDEPIFEISGNLGSPLRLLSGKKLQYEDKCAKPETRHEFVTLVRYTPEAPLGQATALFNWKSGVIEVVEQESVLFVALLSAILSASLTKHLKRLNYTSTLEAEDKKKVFPTGSDSGDGTPVNGTVQKIQAGRRYGRGCWGGCFGGYGGHGGQYYAGAIANRNANKSEMGMLLALGTVAITAEAASGCGGACGAGCGGACGA